MLRFCIHLGVLELLTYFFKFITSLFICVWHLLLDLYISSIVDFGFMRGNGVLDKGTLGDLSSQTICGLLV